MTPTTTYHTCFNFIICYNTIKVLYKYKKGKLQSMDFLSNQLLIESYQKAKEMNLDPKFIEILKNELHNRKIVVKELIHIS